MRRILDKIEIVLNKHLIQCSDFLDPYEVYLAKSILNRFDDLKYLEYGGYDAAERRIIIIYPYYLELEEVDEYLACIKLLGDFESLSHKDFLGALLNLGIKREKVGDILVHQDRTYVILKEEIGEFVLYNLEKVGNRRIKAERVKARDLEAPEVEYEEVIRFLTSLRIDLAISEAYNLSRKDSLDLIKRGFVKLNGEPIDKTARELAEGDVVSVRGYGRFILHSIDGISKKGRYRSTIRILL